jgi:hypothetical protein
MSSAVKSRPNYYELLGLEPSASADDVGRAFARELGLFRPRPFGGVAEMGLAYQTLRDPAKRRAYDESIGLRREPPPPSPPPRPYITNAIFVRPPAVHAGPAARPEPHTVATPAPQHVVPEPAPTASLIAAQPAFAEPAAPAEAAFVRPLPRIAMRLSETPFEAEDEPVSLNRTIAIAGSLILAVGMVGAWAGSEAGQDAQEVKPKAAVTMRVPAATPAQAKAEPAAVEAPPILFAQPEPRLRATPPRGLPAVAAEPVAPVQSPPDRTVADQNRFARDSMAQATEAEPLALESPPVAVAASLPLSDATVARTIQRIGYSCGKVASTVAGEAAGVFTVTCTSGQSFQARPVRGRYHFRRLGR